MKKLVAVSTILVMIHTLFASAVFSKTIAPPLLVLSSEAAIVMEATTGQVRELPGWFSALSSANILPT